MATALVVAFSVFAMGVWALASPGNPARHARLNDAGVWVSTDLTIGPDATAAMFGEIDIPAAQFSATLTPPTATTGLDVIQMGEVAAGVDTKSGTLTPIDPYGLKLNTGDGVKLGKALAVIGGDSTSGVVAVVDQAQGLVWATAVDTTSPLGSLSPVDPSTAKSTAKVGPQAQVAIGLDSVVHAISAKGGLTALEEKPTTRQWTKSAAPLPPGFEGNLQITSVGSRVVALAIADGADTPRLLLPGGAVVDLGPVALGGAVELQQPGPDSNQVLLTTSKALLTVSLSDGTVQTLIRGTGTPAPPVYFQGCQFAAWAGASAYEARICGRDRAIKQLPSNNGAGVTDLVFRENHEQLVLNDRGTGQVWQDQSGNPTQIADWLAVQRPTRSSQNQEASTPSQLNKLRAPKANDVTLGARPGRVTPLHVLDFDSTPANSVMAVNSVGSPTSADARLQIAPDSQSILADIGLGATGSFTFVYDVSNGGRQVSNKATVTVIVVPNGIYVRPTLRNDFAEPAWSVPANGTLTIPVLNDWRVYPDGDPPALSELTPSSVSAAGATAIATADGSLVYRAGKNPGNDVIKYTVIDGDKLTQATVAISIQGRTSSAVAPVASNDYVRVTVGQPTTIYPLANDLPGSDPLTPNASLSLAGAVKGLPGLEVSPPTAKGAVIVAAVAADNYTLTYEDRYGSINGNVATIRVEAVMPDPNATVRAAPATVTVRGEMPGLVDPLAGDFSPYGGLLTVIGAKVADTSNLQVAVVRGAYLRVNARQSLELPGTQNSTSETFDYVVTDGHSTSTAQVIVIEMPPMANDVPVAETVYADVRAGDSVAVPVLDRAVDPAGDTLNLVQDSAGAPAPGQLVVTATTPGQALGAAFASGSVVRFVAPPVDPTVAQMQQVTVEYHVVNSTGGADTGSAIITIHPRGPQAQQTDQAPLPQDVTARVVAGGTVTIPVPTSNVDPDGDSVQVEGLGVPSSGDPQPRLGAVVAYSANSITYQAYPSATNAGTDIFTYVVADTFGLTARATVQIAVVQPTVLPAPVAHSFTVDAAANTSLALDVISPSHVDYPDGAPPTLLDPTKVQRGGQTIAKLDRRVGWLDLAVPPSTPTGTASINYEVVADLGPPTSGTITVQIRPGYVIPPVAVDEFAKPSPKASSVDVDLLVGDYSPTGGTLSVVDQTGVTNGHLRSSLTGFPQVIPFVIADSNGGKATAVAYIPATGSNSTPYWNGNEIQIPESRPTTVDIAQYVIDPQGAPLHLTDRTKVWSSPSPGLTAQITGVTAIQLTGAAGYQGPASMTFAVTRSGDINEFTLVTIPVIVGSPTPVLRCPTDVVDVEQGLVGGSLISPRSQCHVWVPPSVDPSSLRFNLSWKSQPNLVSISRNDEAQVAISADHNAKPGTSGILTVTIDGYHSPGSDMNVAVVAAPSIRVAPISVQGILTTGQPTVIDLSSHVSSPFGFDAVSIVTVGTIPNVSIGHATGTIRLSTTKLDLSGQFQLGYTVTDISNQADISRWKSGIVTVQFIGVPGVPTAVTPRPGYQSGQVPVTWVAPPDNGAVIDNYMVTYTADQAPSGQQQCAASGCVITGLTNGANYHFCVVAHNLAGWGIAPGGCGPTAGTPDQIPGVVTGFKVVLPPSDRALVLQWNPVVDASSSAQWTYTITWSGGVSGSHAVNDRTANSYTVGGLDNDSPENFTIVASNRAGTQPTETLTSGQSAGKPPAPTFSRRTFVPTKTASGQAAVIISWQADDPNGPGPVTYTLVKDNTTTVCTTQQLQCTDTLSTDGSDHYYTVSAANKWNPGPPSAPTKVEAAVQPNQMAAPTINAVQSRDPDGKVTVNFSTVPSNGAQLTVHCTYTSNGSSPTTGSPTCPTSPWAGYSPAGSQSDSKALTGLSPSTSVPIQVAMWEDNGSTQNGTANLDGPISPASNSVNTNAPPSTPQSAGCGLNGTTVQWNWTASSTTNGRGVSYVYTVDLGTGSTTSTNFAKPEPRDGGQRTLTVYAQDSFGDRSGVTTSITCSDPPQPQWQVMHGPLGSCNSNPISGPSSECVYVQLINDSGGSVSCSATGSGGLANWGPITLNGGSSGTSGWTNTDSSGRNLRDTIGFRYTNGTFPLGYINSGLTCQ